MVVIGQTLLYTGKMVLFRQSGCILARWLYLGKRGCIRAKVVVFGLLMLYSGNLFYLVKSGCVRGKSGCIGAKLFVFGQSGCFR